MSLLKIPARPAGAGGSRKVLIISFNCFGQEPIFFDKDWKPTTSANAEFYRIEKKEGTKWLRTDYYFKTKQLQMKGTYSSLNPAKEEGYFEQTFYGDRFDKIQILTVEHILDDRGVEFPDSRKMTFKKAVRKIEESKDSQAKLDSLALRCF